MRAIFYVLKTNEDYLSQIALKNMQLIVDYTFREPAYTSFLPLGLSINFPKLVIHNIDIVIVDQVEMVNTSSDVELPNS